MKDVTCPLQSRLVLLAFAAGAAKARWNPGCVYPASHFLRTGSLVLPTPKSTDIRELTLVELVTMQQLCLEQPCTESGDRCRVPNSHHDCHSLVHKPSLCHQLCTWPFRMEHHRPLPCGPLQLGLGPPCPPGADPAGACLLSLGPFCVQVFSSVSQPVTDGEAQSHCGLTPKRI